jgi:hypothetical protein
MERKASKRIALVLGPGRLPLAPGFSLGETSFTGIQPVNGFPLCAKAVETALDELRQSSSG